MVIPRAVVTMTKLPTSFLVDTRVIPYLYQNDPPFYIPGKRIQL